MMLNDIDRQLEKFNRISEQQKRYGLNDINITVDRTDVITLIVLLEKLKDYVLMQNDDCK